MFCFALLRLCFALLRPALPCFALLCLCFAFASQYLVFFYITSQQTPQFSSPSGNTIINHVTPFELPLPHSPCTYPSSPLAFVSIRDTARIWAAELGLAPVLEVVNPVIKEHHAKERDV